jgi:hypothetical protein
MPQPFQAFDPDSEVVGSSILAFIQCSRYENIAPHLEKHGLTDVDPKGWYPVQTWLDTLRDIAEHGGGMDTMFDFVSIGMKLSEVVPLPPEYDHLPFYEALMATGARGYQFNHRGDVGEQRVELVDDHRLRVTIRTPYPDDLFYGFYYGLVRRYMPAGIEFTVAYDDSTLRRDQGGEATVLYITWETTGHAA